MKSIPPITTDLFRFVSLRTPQLLDQERRDLGFIFIPDQVKSYFLSAVTSDEIDEAREQVQGAAAKFSSLSTYRKVRDIDPDLYLFSHWLIKRRSTLTKEMVADRCAGLTVLSLEKLQTLWDNLFYQLISRKTASVRQACIQMIIADNFLRRAREDGMEETARELIDTPRKPTPPTDAERVVRYLRRLARAKVVVPKVFSATKKETNAKSVLPGISGSLLSALPAFDRSQSMALAQAISYDADAAKGEIAKRSSAKSSKPLTADGIDGAPISSGARSMIKNMAARGLTADAALGELETKMADANKAMYRAAGDVAGRKAKSAGIPSLGTYAKTTRNADGTTSVLATIATGGNGDVVSAEYRLKDGDKVVASGSEIEALATADGLANVKLFPSGDAPSSIGRNSTLEGTFAFQNGKKMSVAASPTSPGIFAGSGALLQATSPVETTEEAPEPTLFGVNRLGVGVFRKVEQEVCCYVPGEVSRIENILAREYKERHTRNLLTTETTEEETTETEIENQTDTATTTRNELQTEVAEVLDEASNVGVGASLGATAEYMGSSISADAYLDFASSTASSSSDSEARTYAQEVVNSALERIVQKTTMKRTTRMLQEFEENNRHGFDNREGTEHVTGVYRWVDIIYTNRLMNYGKRLMVEFLIPEPARFYKKALEAKAAAESGTNEEDDELVAPVDPKDLGIEKATDVIGYGSDANYQDLAATYGVSISAPPEEERSTSLTFSQSDLKKTKEFSEEGSIPVPTGYRCNHAVVDVEFRHDARNSQGTHWVVKVGGDKWEKNIQEAGNDDRTWDKADIDFNFDYLTDLVPFSVTGDRTLSYTINVTLKCEVLPEDYENWQVDAYDKIVAAYEAALAEHESAVEEAEAAAEESEEELSASNPDTNRTIEQREIQRVAIEMLTKPFGIDVGRDFYTTGTCDVPAVIQNEDWEAYSSHVKFFEQAFEWKYMAYLFYPYYWASECDWTDLIQLENADDPTFQAFLQSGMARVVVPVRLGFESAVDYYIETGDIWNGGDLVLETDDDLYLSIEEELAEIEGFVEEEWQTRVPTSLTIVQGDSVYLEDEGLPCCDDVDTDTLLRGSTAILGGSGETTTA